MSKLNYFSVKQIRRFLVEKWGEFKGFDLDDFRYYCLMNYPENYLINGKIQSHFFIHLKSFLIELRHFNDYQKGEKVKQY